MTTQLDDDINMARLNAGNCLILEERDGVRDRGDFAFNSSGEIDSWPVAETWQCNYTLWTLAELGADRERLTAAARKCRQDAATAVARREPDWVAPELSRAADLCELAVRMLEKAGAICDAEAIRSLLASCKGTEARRSAEAGVMDLMRSLVPPTRERPEGF
jgi:hypothetical protein